MDIKENLLKSTKAKKQLPGVCATKKAVIIHFLGMY